REPVKDVARNLARWVDLVVARVFAQQSIVDLAKYADIPVINALSDEGHPCQAVADLFTVWDSLRERGDLSGFNMTYIGDGNNVCNSLILIAGLLGFHLTVCTPSGYEPHPAMTWQGREMSHDWGGAITFELDPVKAVKNSDAIYTDVWTSMGQEEESEERRRVFQSYQVNEGLLSQAPSHAVVMHCLPAHRGEEITDGVLESDRSVVFEQAENRLHTQKALMKYLCDQSE
ncbi:ornithine carbamoyltransferase, partial [bacterium]|nr:ornithine carbamoyltransferase [bacterium]